MKNTQFLAVKGFIGLVTLFVYIAHLSFGANNNALATSFAAAIFFLCLISLAFFNRGETVLATPGFKIILSLFVLLLFVLSLQLMPVPAEHAHLFWAWVGTSDVITLDRDVSLMEMVKLGALAAFFVVGMSLGIQDKSAEVFFIFFIIVGAVFSMWAFMDYLHMALSVPIEYAQHFRRLDANFGSANSAATLFGILSVFSLAAFIRTVKSTIAKTSNRMVFIEALIKRSAVPIISLLLTLTSLLLTASRGGILSSFVAILVLICWELFSSTGNTSRVSKFSGTILISGTIIVLVIIISGGLFFDRLDNSYAYLTSRAEMLTYHWQAIKASPWTGYGMGSFYLVNDTLMNAQSWRVLHGLGAMHNVYLQWLEEAGIIGSTLMFFTITLILWHIHRGLRIRRRMHTWLRAIICISLLLLLHGFVDYGLQVPSIAMTWALLLGTGFGLATQRKR